MTGYVPGHVTQRDGSESQWTNCWAACGAWAAAGASRGKKTPTPTRFRKAALWIDDRLRAALAPGRITTAEWIEVIRTAHQLGLRTSATMMFGHIENALHRVRHMGLLREIQRETGGFSEFVPLSFVAAEAPLAIATGPAEHEVLRTYAIARLMLGSSIPNLQASWVKQGLPLASRTLRAGANDLGGTLMNESISTTAGARHGQLVTPRTLRTAITGVGREPWERTTTYELLAPARVTALDRVSDPGRVFGSYQELASDQRFRYRERDRVSRLVEVQRESRARKPGRVRASDQVVAETFPAAKAGSKAEIAE